MDRSILGSEVQLPSKGLLYDGKIPDGNVKVLPMTTREEKVLTGSTGDQTFKAIDTIFSRCVDGLGDVPPQNLLLGDRFYLLLVLRAVSFGKDYSFRLNCSSCNQTFINKIEIPDDIDLVYLPDDFKEPITAKLPLSGAEVDLRLMRGEDETKVAKYKKNIISKSSSPVIGDIEYSYRVALQILEVRDPDPNIGTITNDNRDALDLLVQWVENLYAMDNAEIRKALVNNDFGPNTEMEVRCPACAVDFRTVMPYDVEFFRPGSRRGL